MEKGAPETRITDSCESVLTPRDEFSEPGIWTRKSPPTDIVFAGSPPVNRSAWARRNGKHTRVRLNVAVAHGKLLMFQRPRSVT